VPLASRDGLRLLCLLVALLEVFSLMLLLFLVELLPDLDVPAVVLPEVLVPLVSLIPVLPERREVVFISSSEDDLDDADLLLEPADREEARDDPEDARFDGLLVDFLVAMITSDYKRLNNTLPGQQQQNDKT
jgi:hypothetical protein